MSFNLAETELSDRYTNYIIQLESLFKSGQDAINVAEQLPLGIHINDAENFTILDCNQFVMDYTGYSKEELYQMRDIYFEKHMHPYIRDIVPKQILRQVHDNPNKVIGFIQYLHLYGDESEFKPLLTFTKLSKKNPTSIICIDVLPSVFSIFPQEIEWVLEMDEFKLNHLKRYQQLTDREKEILSLLAEGLNNPQIADQLFISRKTVDTHRKRINRKLEIKHFRDVINYALAFDLVNI